MSALSYDIKAIPTMFMGRKYRSRLEAKWAAFFHLLSTQRIVRRWEYEPLDLGGWSPDFYVDFEWGSVLVEVKPISEFHPATADKLLANDPEFCDLLLVGLSPWIDTVMINERLSLNMYGVDKHILGWMYSRHADDWFMRSCDYADGSWDKACNLVQHKHRRTGIDDI